MLASPLIAQSALVLTAAAATAAWRLTGPGDRARPVRLASAFVVAAVIAFPAPYGLVVAIAALVTSRGAGLAEALGPGGRAAFAGTCGALAASASGTLPIAHTPIAGAAVVTLAMSGTILVLEWALGAGITPSHELAYGLAVFAAAALLESLVRANDVPGLVLAAGLLAASAHVQRALSGALADATGSQSALVARESELATIQAIGKEVVATVDTERIFGIVERECRKLFEVDFFFVGLLDRDANEIAVTYRSSGDDKPRQVLRPMGDDLASWIVREKRPLRLDDAPGKSNPLPFRPHVVNNRIRSVLASPLLLGERVVGVISVQSERPAAYDDQKLALLSTMAQQASVAVEHARQHQAATIDGLTRLPLRELFLRRVEEESTRATRYAGAFSVLMLDLDGFKEINDRHGHTAGDRYLRAVGVAIQAALRGADVACRYGGDEFCILLPATGLAGARPIAERLRLAISRLVVDVEGVTLRTTASIGISAHPDDGALDASNALLRADSALYRAKREGPDRVASYLA